MFWRRDDVSTQVKLIDLSEGNDVDSFNVTAANLKDNKNTDFISCKPNKTRSFIPVVHPVIIRHFLSCVTDLS